MRWERWRLRHVGLLLGVLSLFAWPTAAARANGYVDRRYH